MNNIKWKKIKWPYNHQKPYCDWKCYQATIFGFKVILYPGDDSSKGWSYVIKEQLSGFLPGSVTLNSAKIQVVKQIQKYI